jgi:hypothetical protein
MTPKEIKEFVLACKNDGVKLPTILLIPGLPRLEGKNAIFPDGRVLPLSEVLQLRSSNVAISLPKSRQGGGKL